MGHYLGQGAALSFDAASGVLKAFAPASADTPEIWVSSLDAPDIHALAMIPAGQIVPTPIGFIVPGDKYVFTLEDATGAVLDTLTVDTTSGTPVITGGAGIPASPPAPPPGPGPKTTAPPASFLDQDSLGLGMSNLMYLLIGGGAILFLKRKG